VIRDTQPTLVEPFSARGIETGCQPATETCGSLVLERCLVAGHQEIAVFTWGTETTIRDCLVRDTSVGDHSQAYGRGIEAGCSHELGVCAPLHVHDTFVVGNEDTGIAIYGVSADLQGVTVLDTVTNTAGPWAGQHGQAVAAFCDVVLEQCGSLDMIGCLLGSSQGAGLLVQGISGALVSSVVDTVLAQPDGAKFGHGVQIGSLDSEPISTFHVRSCAIRDARLAGLLYHRSQGTLSRTSISGAEHCVAMNEGSAPTITADNQLACTVASEPEWVNLMPAPAPPPATPSLPSE
jgi:hypothetical protein